MQSPRSLTVILPIRPRTLTVIARFPAAGVDRKPPFTEAQSHTRASGKKFPNSCACRQRIYHMSEREMIDARANCFASTFWRSRMPETLRAWRQRPLIDPWVVCGLRAKEHAITI